MLMRLLGSRRFLGFFWAQFTVAFNDNLLKTGIILMMTFGRTPDGEPLTVFGMGAEALNPLAAALLIIPFILFSASAGQLADRVSKTRIIRAVKLAEVVIMGIAAVAFVASARGYSEQALAVLVALLLLAGTQSALNGPAKYSIVPELTEPEELVAGNALLQLGGYLSILTGIIGAGLLIEQPSGPMLVGAALVAASLVGYLSSLSIPHTAPANPDGVVQWLSPRPILAVLARLHSQPVMRRSVTGISWFWAFGACLVTLFPTWTRDVLHAGPGVATLCMALFSIGIGLGSALCSRLSPHGLELGLVAIGAIGLTVFPLLLGLVGTAPIPASADVATVADFFATGYGWTLALLMVLIAACGGLFIVPLYALIQSRPAPEERGQISAANNLVSSVYIVASQLLLIGLAAAGLGTPAVFVVLAGINLLGFVYLYTLIPEFMYRFLAWVLSNVMYRLKVEGIQHIPKEGPCVLVCNHVSFVDWLIVGGACPRPGRFVMDKFMFQLPVANVFVRHARAIPIASRKVDPEMLERAFELIAAELAAGQVVCIFPEGGLTRDGEPLEYRPGIERIIAASPVPVIPMALNGLWGSFFSRVDGAALKKPFRRGFRSELWLTVGTPIEPGDVNVELVRDRILEIWRARTEK